MALLVLDNVTRRFGGVLALDDVSLEVDAGEIVGLIGPNGAGKTTAFNVITRLYDPDQGDVVFDGETLLKTPPHRVIRRGDMHGLAVSIVAETQALPAEARPLENAPAHPSSSADPTRTTDRRRNVSHAPSR